VKKDRIVCGLDVGTTKICMMIARVHRNGGLELLSTGYADSGGMKKEWSLTLKQRQLP